MAGEVYVGALLFGLDDSDEPGPLRWRIGQGHHGLGGEKPTIRNGEIRKSAESSKIDLLACGSVRVAGCSAHAGGEISDPVNLVTARKELGAELGYVQPLEGGAFDAPVVEVEAVDVDVGCSHKKAEAARGQPRAPSPKG